MGDETGLGEDLPLATIAHEFLSPLGTLRGYVELAIKESPSRLSSQQREHLNTALSAADRLQHFIEDMVAIARLEGGRHPLELAEAAPAQLVLELKAELLRHTPTGLTVEERCADLTPLPLDVSLVRRVLAQLGRHALQFVPRGGTVRLEVAGDCVAVVWTLLEFGVRLEADELGRFFERFLQPYFAESGARVRQSSLAMSMSKLIIEKHGGRIWVEQLPEGLALRFSIPR